MAVGGRLQVAGVDRLPSDKSFIGRAFKFGGKLFLVVSEDVGQDPLSSELVSKGDWMLNLNAVRNNGGFRFSEEDDAFVVSSTYKSLKFTMKREFFESFKSMYLKYVQTNAPPIGIANYRVSTASPIKASELFRNASLGGDRKQRKYVLKSPQRASWNKKRTPLARGRPEKRPKFASSSPVLPIRLDNFHATGVVSLSPAKSSTPAKSPASTPPAFFLQSREFQTNEGFRNVGNSCYAGSVLQLLLRTTDLAAKIKTSLADDDDDALPRLLVNVHEDLLDPLKSPNVLEIKHKLPRFRDFRQHDAHEFLTDLLDRISSFEKLSECVKSTLESKVLVELECSKCGVVKSKEEEFLVHSVEVFESAFVSLKNHFKSETVECRCDDCDSTQATMNYVLTKLPKFLLVHFKLFNAVGQKITSTFELNDELDVSQSSQVRIKCERVEKLIESERPMLSISTPPPPQNVATPTTTADRPSNKTVYELRGCVEHVGSIASHGHYTATLVQPDATTFKTYDDDRISTSSKKPTQAYVACYELR